MIAAMLDAGGIEPTVINGGIINSYGSNARLGKSSWMVVEADESDGSFLRLDGTIAVVTNIDPEHLDHYGDFEKVKKAFCEFIENVPFYGLAVMCVDHPEVQSLIGRIRDRRIVTYGTSALADIRAENIRPDGGGSRFDSSIVGKDGERRLIADIFVPMPGRHNVLNALAAVAVGIEFGMDDDIIARGFEKFDGVKRRFSRVGEVDGATIIDDYAHHPVEIRSVLSAARESVAADAGGGDGSGGGRVIAVVQPHRFTRLRDLEDEFQAAFNDADAVFVTPVYAAGEEPIDGVDSEALAEGLRARGHRMVKTVRDPAELACNLRDLAAEGDLVVCMGAGDITKWAAGLADGIKAARAAKSPVPQAGGEEAQRAEGEGL